MAQRPNISFIPKQSLAKGGSQKRRPVSLLMVISVGLLLLSAGAYGGLYFYANSIAQDNVAKEEQLNSLRGDIDRSTLEEARLVEARLEGADALVQQHIALSSVFAFLEENTLSDVQLTSFSFARETEEGGEGTDLTLSLDGRAPDFAGVIALRRSLFENTDVLANGELTNVSLGEAGEVNFGLRAVVDPSAITYISEPAEENEAAPQTESSTSTTTEMGTTTSSQSTSSVETSSG